MSGLGTGPGNEQKVAHGWWKLISAWAGHTKGSHKEVKGALGNSQSWGSTRTRGNMWELAHSVDSSASNLGSEGYIRLKTLMLLFEFMVKLWKPSFEGLTRTSRNFGNGPPKLKSHYGLGPRFRLRDLSMMSSTSSLGLSFKFSSLLQATTLEERDTLLLSCFFHINTGLKLNPAIWYAPEFSLVFSTSRPHPFTLHVLVAWTLCCHNYPNTHLFIWERTEDRMFWKHFAT